MNKIMFSNDDYSQPSLIIEVTRRCNMECEHCLRGDAEDNDFNPDYLETFIKKNNIEHISTITFAGGEPSLVPNVISKCLEILEKYKVELGSFYIATNGKVIPDEFLLACMKLYLYSDNKDMCQLDLSNDAFHEEQDDINLEKINVFKFSSKRNEKDYDYNDNSRFKHLILEGNWRDYGDGRALNDKEIHEELYLNTDGILINGCNWSYESQDNNDNIRIGHVNDVTIDDINNFYENLTEKEEVVV